MTQTAIADGPNLDPFSRLRVGLPQLRLSALFDSDKRPLFWDESTTGTGAAAHVANERAINMTVAASGDECIRQTKEYYVYRAAQGQLILATFVLGQADDNVRQRIGYFDANDGIFLERDGADVSIVLRSYATGSVVETRVAQSDWNINRLDGKGRDTLDLEDSQILVIDFQWLGVGRVRVGFDIGGVIVYVHEFMNANENQGTVYMRTPKLPVRYEITATGVPVETRTLKQICSAVIREGGADEPSVQHEGRSNASVTVGTAWETVVGVRLTSGNIRATLRPLRAVLFNEDTGAVEYGVIINPTYTGSPTWVSPDPDSIAEIARFNAAISVNGNGDPSAGHMYTLGGYVSGASGNNTTPPGSSDIGDSVPVCATIDGTPDELWVVARAFTGTAGVRGLIAWKEER